MTITKTEQSKDKVLEDESLVECSRCKGEGRIPNILSHEMFQDTRSHETCPRCWGKGKTDWVSNITGSNDINLFDYTSGCSGYSGISGLTGMSGFAGMSGVSGQISQVYSGGSYYSGYLSYQSGYSPSNSYNGGIPNVTISKPKTARNIPYLLELWREFIRCLFEKKDK